MPQRLLGQTALLLAVCTALCACAPREDDSRTVLPTRQSTIDPVSKKLDAAAQEAEKRRAEVERAGN